MSSPKEQFPGLPVATIQASKKIFIAPFKRAIGDQMDVIVRGVDFSGLEFFEEKSNSSNLSLALVTLMQYVESLTDPQTAQATGARMDWKYALHLPVHFPGLEPEILAEFRVALIAKQKALKVFQLLLDHFAEADLLGSRGQHQVKAADVLVALCVTNQLTQLANAMNRVIEALAANQPDWLRANDSRSWLGRYGSIKSNHPLPHNRDSQVVLANNIGMDIFYLLEMIDRDCQPEIMKMQEVLLIRRIWNEQFEKLGKNSQWKLPAKGLSTAILFIKGG